MDPANRVAKMITAPLRELGFDLVRVQISGARQPTLQIMAERRDHANMMVEDCAVISRALSALFDVEDALRWLDEEHPDRFFLYLHVGEVHSPYTPIKMPEGATQIYQKERMPYFEQGIEDSGPLWGGPESCL